MFKKKQQVHIIYLHGGIDDRMSERVNREINLLNLQDKSIPMLLDINTPGGSVYATFSIVNTIQHSANRITGCVNGSCMSGGIPILASCHKRIAYKNSAFMIHGSHYYMSGTVEDHRLQLEHSLKIEEFYYQIILERTGFKPEFLEKLKMHKKDHYFYVAEALENNLIDQII